MDATEQITHGDEIGEIAQPARSAKSWRSNGSGSGGTAD